MRDVLAFAGTLYGTVVGATAGVAWFADDSFGASLRFGAVGTGGLAMMGLGIALYSFLKYARDDH